MNKKFDFNIFSCLILISLLSLFNQLGIDYDYFKSQLIFFIFGFSSFFIAWFLTLNFFKFNSAYFYWINVFLLVLTIFLGQDVRGSRRWIDFYFFNYQASEFLKLFFIIYLSYFITACKDCYDESFFYPKKLLKIVFYFFIPIFLIFKQPDFGSSLVYIVSLIGMLFFANLPFKYFLNSFILFLISSPIFWNFLKPYQKNRIITFINPSHDSSGISYNVLQSIIAIGSGGFFGKGLGYGTQSKLSFLPENHTDFAFASYVEQFGFLGTLILFALFSFIFYLIIKKIFKYKNDPFIMLFLCGSLFYVFFQFFINVGMNMGIAPVTGIPLPFISYGGSSIVSLFMLFGLIAGL